MCLEPTLLAKAVWEVDLEELAARGVRGVILDLDNTIAYWNDREVLPRAREWIARAKESGLGVCLVSNAFRGSRVKAVAEELGIAYVRRAGKPFGAGYRRAMKEMNTSPAETCIIGDQVFTDILGGNRLGVTTILVEPLAPRESPHTRLIRLIERPLRRRWARRIE